MKNLRLVIATVLQLALCLAMGGIFGVRLSAQTSYGTIAGTVTDASGAAVGDAEVTITNIASGEKRVQSTSSDGFYNFVNLIPGTYRVEAEKSGFKRAVHTDVIVDVDQTVRIDLTLQVGEASQTIEVTGETPP